MPKATSAARRYYTYIYIYILLYFRIIEYILYLYILTVKHRCVVYFNIEFELQGDIFYYRVQKKPTDDQDLVINFRMLSGNSKKITTSYR